jgi:phytoene dehydrogenase-like protein
MAAANKRWDATVVGAGPNGLMAALRLATAGRRVLVLEAADDPGGGLRSAELLEPCYRHDLCATIMALTPLSPAVAELGVELDLVTPPAALAHPLDDGSAVLLAGSVEMASRGLGQDTQAYSRLLGPLVAEARPLL